MLAGTHVVERPCASVLGRPGPDPVSDSFARWEQLYYQSKPPFLYLRKIHISCLLIGINEVINVSAKCQTPLLEYERGREEGEGEIGAGERSGKEEEEKKEKEKEMSTAKGSCKE